MAGYYLKAEPGLYRLEGGAVELRLSPEISFKEGSRFFEMVSVFLASTAGLTPVFDATNYPTFLHGTAGVYPGFAREKTIFDLERLVTDIRNGSIEQGRAVELLCCMLANAAWESSGFLSNDPDPMVQVFRHVRHAASHGNEWSFKGNEPRFRGEWRHISFAAGAAEGQRPSGKCFGGSLFPGDLLLLLSDVQHKVAQ